MTLQKGTLAGGIGAIRERPGFFLSLAVIFFSSALLASKALIEPPSIEARIRTEIIDLDAEAEDANSLITPNPFDAQSLRSTLFDEKGLDAENTGNRRPDVTWYDGLTIRAGGEDGEFVIRLGGDDAFQADEKLNGLLQAFASHQNRRRAEQKTEAAFWIERQRTAWQARIDEAKAAIVQSPFDPALPRASGRSESAQLLRFMIDATTEAQAARQANNQGAALEYGSGASSNGLATETTRLTDALRELEAGRAAQLRHGTQLKEAEAGLAKLEGAMRELMARDSILDRRAVTILAPAFAEVTNPLQHIRIAGWQILLPALAFASLVLASIATLSIYGLKPPIKAALGDHLNDPHWPLPPDAHRDLST